MSLFTRITEAFTYDPLVDKNSKLTPNWINWFNQLTSELNRTFVSGRDRLGATPTTQKDIRFLQIDQMTTATRDSVAGLTNGLIIYNTDTNKFQGFAAGIWVDLN